MDPVICDKCGSELHIGEFPFCNGDPMKHIPASCGVFSDGIPGGLEIRHLTKSPKRFYSKTDIRRAANKAGLTWGDDTPKPYRVSWDGKREDQGPT